MYKIYVNGTPVFLADPIETEQLGIRPGKNTFVAPYTGKKKMLKQYLDLLDKDKKVTAVVIFSDQPDVLWEDFKACFNILEAAGGYVQNIDGELLVFFRRGSWDMPKGKIDPGETPEQAAVREVQEETGLVHVALGEFLVHTWHTYEQKGERMLKKTWWYRMQTTDREVIPQTEEDIEEIRWVHPKTWLADKPFVYASIREVIEMAVDR